MKNYLFAPFKSDDEKIEEFNHFKNYLSSGHRNSLIIFIGRLESYYDAIICGLRSENAVADEEEIAELKADNKRLLMNNESLERYNKNEELKVDTLLTENEDLRKACKLLKDDNKELKAENCDLINNANFDKNKMIKELQADNKKRLNEIIELQADNKRLNDKDGLYDEVNELKAENKQLRADMTHDSEVCYDTDDKHIKEIKRLNVKIDELKAEIKEKEEQYHMLASSKSSHYPKEYKAEAEEYFDNNPQCKKLLFFLIDGSEFDWDEDNEGCNGMNGEYNGCLFADDCIAEFDNTEGSE